MNEQIPELLEVMRGEICSYQDLLECEQRKTALLAEGRVEELIECNKVGDDCVARIQEQEIKRLRICDKLCGELRIPREDFTLARLTELFDKPRELDESAELLRGAAQSVQAVGARNRSLIDRSLRYAEGMLAIFSNAAGPYQPNGTFSMEASVLPTFSQNA